MKPKMSALENPAPVVDEEDEETLAAIDEGIRCAKAGRTVPVWKRVSDPPLLGRKSRQSVKPAGTGRPARGQECPRHT
jgi:hypothetical protein